MKLKRWITGAGVGAGLLGILAFSTGYLLINHRPDWIPGRIVQSLRQPELLEHPGAKRCSECHRTIYEAWKKSRHSVAWVSETYIEDSENRSKEKCLSCHIPQPVRPGQKPEPRLTHREDGVYCVSCHVVDRAMNGPYALFSPAHPTRQNPEYRKSKFCSSCHEKTVEEWQATGVDKPCQSCHMPRTPNRRLVQRFFLTLLHSRKEMADHRFPHGEVSDREVRVSAEFEAGRVTVTLLNATVPHHVPTADNGDPRLFLYVSFLDETGRIRDTFKEILAPQQDTALPYQQPVSYRYRLREPVKRLAVALKYRPAWSKEKQDVLERTFAPGAAGTPERR
ncbi:MAG: hypothetical protein GWM98_06280 [Nitrospinaceae bacterium]|nr:hypothetical protein [Nitrospinaceae bacterium]NIR54166.1 hypothetical protein [Nitrospinaceae bacterium]NIS84584.1 hypothetical protein [Nitrospinaceae bacterium]NIT81376.1 hypothetical protein [Nitrospinaceae bacterium]NIU43663.1 hypothetical protein [Nitrospinaceae bacterium]